ncbi:Urease accessory protein UreH [Haemophilus influenzae]|nr:Urease accessory protein UreH [Haemophilus influenzae]PRK14488.1 Urease accessory protein UreH [Haemophilus influenzae]PRM40701.1 Urease accessory protein UreH [Haemophilus influenzae]
MYKNFMNSKLSLSTKLSSNGKTQLAEYFATPPFKVITLPSYDDAWANGLNAMQMSSSPGVLAGDVLEIDISLAKLTALSLNTQAFTRVQAMNEGDSAEQITRIALAENSRLFYLPHPLVLHKDSVFKQQTQIEMGEQSELIYGEIVAIGRVLNDERFAFRQFSSHLKIYAFQNDSKKRPLVSDCIQWLPSKMNLTALSQMEDYSHQGSLTYLNLAKNNAEIKQQVQALQQQFMEEQGLLIGISQLNEYGLMVRVLGCRAEQIQNLFEKIGKLLKST